MIRGFTADKSEGQYFTLSWVDGEPVNASIFGITGDNINMRGAAPLSVRGMRCEKCGFLEFYAV